MTGTSLPPAALPLTTPTSAALELLVAATPIAMAWIWAAGGDLDTFLVPWISKALLWTTLVDAVVVAFALARRAAPWKPAFFVAVAGLVVVPARLFLAGFTTNDRIEERTAPSGVDYAVFSAIGMDSPRLLVRKTSSGLWSRYELIQFVHLRAIEERTTAIVLPAADDDDAGRLIWFGPKGHVAFAPDGRCLAMYDEHAAARVEPPAPPFALLDDDDEGRASDVEALVAEARSGTPLAPSDDALLADLDHANPWSRAAARRLVEAGPAAMYPLARRRLASAPK